MRKLTMGQATICVRELILRRREVEKDIADPRIKDHIKHDYQRQLAEIDEALTALQGRAENTG